LGDLSKREAEKKVLDLGTGSGILALAAAKWGAEKVLAIDCNELAVETTLRNVLSNEESQRIEVRMGKAEDFIEEEADLVCASIHLQVIEFLLKKRPFSRRDAEEIERRLIRRSVEIVRRLQEKNWLTHSAAPSSAL
jgi:ribosomal protein L11 methyltransferase